MKTAAIEILFTCRRCGQGGFTKRGLVAHEAQGRCQKLSMSKPTTKDSRALVLLKDKAITVNQTQLPKLQAAALEQLAAIPRLEREAAARAILAGLTLHRVKASLEHGEWTPWFKAIEPKDQKRTTGSFLPTIRQCQFYMRLAFVFIEKTGIRKPEMLALPGDQLDLKLASASEQQKDFYSKLEKFVGDCSLNELLDKHGIKVQKALGGDHGRGEPAAPKTPEEMHFQSLEEMSGVIQHAELLFIKENRLQYLHAHPEEIRGIVESLRELADKVEKAAKALLKKS